MNEKILILFKELDDELENVKTIYKNAMVENAKLEKENQELKSKVNKLNNENQNFIISYKEMVNQLNECLLDLDYLKKQNLAMQSTILKMQEGNEKENELPKVTGSIKVRNYVIDKRTTQNPNALATWVSGKI